MVGEIGYSLLLIIIGIIVGSNFRRIRNNLIKYVLRKKNEEEQKLEEKDNKDNSNNKDEEEEYDFDDEDLKMVFLVRDDLKLGAGKIAAQVAHAAVGLFEQITSKKKNTYYKQALKYWSEFGAKKIVLRCKDYDELKKVKGLCTKIKIPNLMISDAGHTQVDPGTVTVLGIGPEASEKLNKITGEYKLMR